LQSETHNAAKAARRYAMTATTIRPTRLPDMVGWNLRRPTVDECELVGRDVGYAKPLATVMLDDGDTVVETTPDPEAQAKLAEAFELFGMCDMAHVIPAGVYLEE